MAKRSELLEIIIEKCSYANFGLQNKLKITPLYILKQDEELFKQY